MLFLFCFPCIDCNYLPVSTSVLGAERCLFLLARSWTQALVGSGSLASMVSRGAGLHCGFIFGGEVICFVGGDFRSGFGVDGRERRDGLLHGVPKGKEDGGGLFWEFSGGLIPFTLDKTRGFVVTFVADGGFVGVPGARAYCSAWDGKARGVGSLGSSRKFAMMESAYDGRPMRDALKMGGRVRKGRVVLGRHTHTHTHRHD
ncbi:hypothetical protein B0J18DRAFT_151971 [Chaetomium sp. MPI-SDFR-AT-0129]|nr:hypothetical protein B0J18DRAFT_151971 [Chaetomium sp. MPI-SDFR-AT-0129]